MSGIQENAGVDATTQDVAKRAWTKPGISTFEAVDVTKSVFFRLGDGLSNLS